MADFQGTPPQFAKALVMGHLMGEYFAKWGRAGDAQLADASRLADAILAASVGPAPALPARVQQPPQQPPQTSGMMHMGGGISLPSMPSPPGNPAHIVPSTPGANPSPPVSTAQLPYTGHVVPGAGVSTEGSAVLDLSQPR